MPIDSNIALQYRAPEIQNPMNAMAAMAQIQHAQNQNVLNQYQIQKAQREEQVQNSFNRAYQQAYDPVTGKLDYSKLQGAAINAGLGSKLPEIQKSIFENQKAETDQQKAQSDLFDAKLKQSRELLAGVNTPDQYLSWVGGRLKDPVLGPVLQAHGITPETVTANLQGALSKPGGFQEVLNHSALTVEKFAELNKPQLVSQDSGGKNRIMSVPGMGGIATVVPGSEIKKTMAPGEAERIGLERQRVGLEGARVGLENQRLGLEGQRVGIALRDEARKQSDYDFQNNFGISKKDAAEREKQLPQVKSAVTALTSNLDALGKVAGDLAKHPGLEGMTGNVIWQNIPSLRENTRNAEAQLEVLKSKIMLDTLNSMRAASKTGASGLGALNKSEGDALRNSIAALDPKQGTKAFKEQLKIIQNKAQDMKAAAQQSFNDQYSYREKALPAAGTSISAPAVQLPSGWSVTEH